MIAVAAECSFCPATIEVESTFEQLLLDVHRDPSLLEPGWRAVAVDDHEVVTFCPRCLEAFGHVAAAVDAGLQQALDHRARLYPRGA